MHRRRPLDPLPSPLEAAAAALAALAAGAVGGGQATRKACTPEGEGQAAPVVVGRGHVLLRLPSELAPHLVRPVVRLGGRGYLLLSQLPPAISAISCYLRLPRLLPATSCDLLLGLVHLIAISSLSRLTPSISKAVSAISTISSISALSRLSHRYLVHLITISSLSHRHLGAISAHLAAVVRTQRRNAVLGQRACTGDVEGDVSKW